MLIGCAVSDRLIWIFGHQILQPDFAFTKTTGSIRVALKCFGSSFPGTFQFIIFILPASLSETVVANSKSTHWFYLKV